MWVPKKIADFTLGSSHWEALRISKRLVEVIGTRLCSFLA